jgi:hypothetical protein
MNAKQYLDKYGKTATESLALRAGTSFAYFYQIALGHSHPSRKMALRLVKESGGEMTLVELMTFERAA